jgi:LuxR family quorum-sensing system transcriptional regulator CciR
MTEASLDGHLDDLARAKSLRAAAGPLVEIGKAVGLDRPAAVEDFTSERLIMSRDGGLLGEIFGWLETQGEHIGSESLADMCPIGRACRMAVHPFAWRAAEIGAAEFTWDRRARGFWARAADRGIIGGVTVPVHMPLSRVGAVGWLAIGQAPDLETIVERWSSRLRLAAYMFMDHVYRERPDTARMAPDAGLTERELECLTWVALGKTDAEIGELMGRSPSTARFHVESAVAKLGVNNRTRAAAVACQMGMIRALA